MILGASGVGNFAGDISFIVILSLLTVVVFFLAVWLLTRFINRKEPVLTDAEVGEGKQAFPVAQICMLLLAFGVVIRILFSFIIKGYREDFNIVFGSIGALGETGLTSYYYESYGLYPLLAYIYSFFGLIAGAGWITVDSIWAQVFVKLPMIIADMATAYMVYKIAKKYLNSFVSVIVLALYCILPIFFTASSVWGSTYSIMMLFIVLSLYFMLTKNYPAFFGTYTLALLSGKDAIFLFPMFAVFIVYNLVKAIGQARALAPKSFGDIMADKNARNAVLIPIYFVASFLLFYFLCLPVGLKVYGANPFIYIYKFLLEPLVNVQNFGYNALNIYNIVLKNGESVGSSFPTWVFLLIFGLIILAIVLITYLSKKNRANLVLMAAYILTTVNIYFVGSSAFGLLTAAVVLLMAFLLIGDKRILSLFGAFSLIIFLNAATVLVSAGYLNNADASAFTAAAYTGKALLDSGVYLALSIVYSVLTVLAHIYFTFVLLDISVSVKRKPLIANDKGSIFSAAKNLFTK